MRAVTSFSGRLAVAVAALAALAVGFEVGTWIAAVGVAGALAFGWGAGALDTDRNSRRALGSVATVVGGMLVLAGVVAGARDVGAAIVVATALVGLTAVAVDATVGLGDDSLSPVLSSLGSSIATAIAGVALASVFHVAALLDVAVVIVGGLAAVSLATALGAFISLQLLALVVGVLMHRSRRTIDGWFPGDVPVETWEEFEPLATTVAEVPRSYWTALGAQVLLLFVPGVVGLVDRLLATTWLFGDAVQLLLQSGLLHGALFLVLLLELGVLLAEFVRSAAISTLSPNPPRSLSYAAGGIALVVAVPLFVGALGAYATVTGTQPDVLFFGPTWGSAAALLSVAVVALGVVFALEVTGVALAERSVVPDRAAGFATGAALLFLAAVLAAPLDAAPLVTFGGVAAALVVWDLGETAVDLGSHLGTETATRRAEVVHATGSVGVAVAGVVLAILGVYVVDPGIFPAAGGRAVAALALALVALVAFVTAIDRRPDVD